MVRLLRFTNVVAATEQHHCRNFRKQSKSTSGRSSRYTTFLAVKIDRQLTDPVLETLGTAISQNSTMTSLDISENNVASLPYVLAIVLSRGSESIYGLYRRLYFLA